MFGWINDCTESLVVTKFGVEKWHEIKAKADCKVIDGGFIRHEYYTDESTVALVVAASEVLGISVEGVLEAFGQYFMEFTRNNGYSNLLSCQGSNLRLWLSNLNALHDHLESSLPHGFVAPVFWCEDDEHQDHLGAIKLHYFSKRGSLLVPIVVGIVKEVALYHFEIEVKMDRLQTQGEDDAKYTTWRISTVDPSEQWKLTSGDEIPSQESVKGSLAQENYNAEGSGDRDTPQCPFSAMAKQMKDSMPINSSVEATPSQSSGADANGSGVIDSTLEGHTEEHEPGKSLPSISMPAQKVNEVFPYHIIVDKNFVIVQVGNSLPGLIGERKLVGRNIKDILQISRPVMGTWDWNTLHKLQDQSFFMDAIKSDSSKQKNTYVKLKGNIINISTSPKYVMFVLSPDAKNVTELKCMGLTFSDLPLHNFQRDAVFLGEHISSEVRSSHLLEKLSKKLEIERNLSNTLLYSMLPKHVANHLRSGKTYEPEHYEDVTLFFSDVVGFTTICSELPPWDIIDMLNRLYSVMDYLASKFNLYKVETIGDAYMCCSGLPEPDDRNAENIANFAIAVKECVKLVTSPFDGKPIELRIGIHSGSCMAGVVGTLTPHFCLFGDMINTTARHESTGMAGKIQASTTTFSNLTQFYPVHDYYDWTPRGLVEMKGKGQMYTYWLDGGSATNPFVSPEKLKTIYNETAEMLSRKKWKKRSYFRQRGSTGSVVEFDRGDDEEEVQ